MLARLFLFKVLNFLKSSRLVFATIVMFGSISCVLAVEIPADSLVRRYNGCNRKSLPVYKGEISEMKKCPKPQPMQSHDPIVPREKYKRLKTHPL